MRAVVLSSLVLLCACHPLAIFNAPGIKNNALMALSESPHRQGKSISVALDTYGIPFIKADTVHEAVYALGFMHARDRLFQLDLVRHAALGRVSELFGERTLDFDRKLRILSYKLSEQMAYLSPAEHELLDAYVRGVNDGAKHRGRSGEHALLGLSFEEFSKEHVIAISRLQSWRLASDLDTEIVRLKIAKSDLDPRAKAEYFAPVDDRNTTIIDQHQTSPDARKLILPDYLKNLTVLNKLFDIKQEFIQVEKGASNAWAVQGSITLDQQAVLMNDPHLNHTWPSNFYLATMAFADTTISGASFVGLPILPIGSSQWVSWGATASYVNNQDTVYLKRDGQDPLGYWIDGKKLSLESLPQLFCLNKKGRCVEEEHFSSVFGPVVDARYDPWIDQDDRLAVMWTGFLIEKHRQISLPFIALAQAKNVFEAADTIGAMTLPGVNLLLADTAANIGYAYAGLLPKRDLAQNPLLPLDGSLKSSLWQGVMPLQDKPKLINPPGGYLITANQNIYAHNTDMSLSFGQQGAPPYRALKIKERLEELIAKKAAMSIAELGDIQLDSVSIEARELAPALGRICQETFREASASRINFASLLASFDGNYTTDSLAALPYEVFINYIIENRLQKLVSESASRQVSQFGQINFAIKYALLKELNGQKTAIFADSDLSKFCEPAFLALNKLAGEASWKWRWGRHHYLQRQSPLASAPLIGGFFRDFKREVAGSGSSPLAELGTPVTHGASLRLRAHMTSPPQINLVIDSGNGGSFGERHSLDQVKLWHEGKTISVVTDWDQAQKSAELRFELIY